MTARSRRPRPASRGVVALLVAIGSLLLLAGPAWAKSFSIDRVEITATWNPDGSLDVRERITYDFDGSFSVGTRPIPSQPPYRVVDMAASLPNGEPLEVLDPDPGSFEWALGPVDDGTHTYDITYTVLGAPIGTDVAELYWKWVGETHPTIGEVDVTITVPGTGEGVRAWGHGSLTGVVAIDGPVVTWRDRNVPPGVFVEGRVAVPSSAFTAPPTSGALLPDILAEEGAYAEEANRLRDEALRQAEAEARRRDRLNVAAPVVALLALAGFGLLWLRYGKEPEPGDDIGEYWREPLDDPPAVVVALREWGQVPATAFGATVVDLAQRGHLTIEEQRDERLGPDKVDWHFRRTGKADTSGLLDFERQTLDLVFRGSAETSQDALTTWAREEVSTAQRLWTAWKGAVTRDYKARGYVRSRGGLVALAALGAFAVGALGVWAVASGAALGWVAIAVGVLLLLCSPLLRQRTPAGARRAAQWGAFRRFVKDFSRLDESPAGDLVLYERYLVYAVALGVSDDLMRGLALRVPEVASGASTFATWYVVSSAGGFDRLSSIGEVGSFAQSFGHAVAVASTPKSSGSGFGGGGFSGGGGGGGGGGGIGAR
ncbi:MAG: DUF2207 domain-containing protein [Acidimicrobiales bacterium]|nr:DUF2207 domain-containing protein [Acidimicrobiales bacterium]